MTYQICIDKLVCTFELNQLLIGPTLYEHFMFVLVIRFKKKIVKQVKNTYIFRMSLKPLV